MQRLFSFHLFFFISYYFLQAQPRQDSLYVLDLAACVEIAVENNLSIKRSLLLKENAQISLNQARASLLPTANVGAGYNMNFGRSIDPTTNQFIAQQINASGIEGSTNVTLFNGFRLNNTIKQSQLDLETSDYDVEKARNDITLNIISFYLNVIFNRELLENARIQLESSTKQLERTKILVASGALPRSSELELISQVASNEVQLINAQNDLDLALLTLKQGMLIPSSQKIDLVVPDLDVEETDLEISADEVFEAALTNMPEIRSADLQVESAQMGVKIAQAGFVPTLSASAGFRTNYSSFADQPIPIFDTLSSVIPIGYVAASGDQVVTEAEIPVQVGETSGYPVGEQYKNNLSKYVQFGLSVPIFNGLQVKSNVQRSKITLQQAEINAIEQRNMLRQIIETAYNNAAAASKTYNASLRQVEALEETFRAIENQYNLGAANFTEYQLASNNLYRAKSDMVRAKFDFIFKKKLVDFYQGKPLDF